jgi:hypothetical protein
MNDTIITVIISIYFVFHIYISIGLLIAVISMIYRDYKRPDRHRNGIIISVVRQILFLLIWPWKLKDKDYI